MSSAAACAVSLTAVCAPSAPLALGGEAGGVDSIAGQRIAADVVVGALCLGVAAWAEAALGAGAAGALGAVDEQRSANRAHCRTAAAGKAAAEKGAACQWVKVDESRVIPSMLVTNIAG
jgi:hypothetical protein